MTSHEATGCVGVMGCLMVGPMSHVDGKARVGVRRVGGLGGEQRTKVIALFKGVHLIAVCINELCAACPLQESKM